MSTIVVLKVGDALILGTDKRGSRILAGRQSRKDGRCFEIQGETE
jgi:hypothetical protein